MDSNESSVQNKFVPSHYVSIEDTSLTDAYAAYIAYRVQRDYYEIYKESGPYDCSWSEFIQALSADEKMRALAAAAARKTLRNFPPDGRFNFDAGRSALTGTGDRNDADRGDLKYAEIFTREEGRGLVGSVLLRAELAQHRLFRGGLSWEEYLDELQQSGPLWDRLTAALREALSRLDFKPVWRLDDERAILR